MSRSLNNMRRGYWFPLRRERTGWAIDEGMSSEVSSPTGPPSAVRELADALVGALLAAQPFEGTELGLREYDALLPDPSREGEERLSAELAELAARADALEVLTPADEVTLAVTRSVCRATRHDLDVRPAEFTVTAMPIAGPPLLLAFFAQTRLGDGQAAADYLTRVQGAAAYLDTGTQRLLEGVARGRSAVGPLLEQAIAWADRTLSEKVPSALIEPQPPADWDGTAAWRSAVEDAAPSVRAAIARWREQLVALRVSARDEERVGLWALDGGEEDYGRLIERHTTLPLTADELHVLGLAEVARLEDRLLELGAGLGLHALSDIAAAMRAASAAVSPEVALAAARTAVRRAEAAAGDLMPLPLPSACAVEPMPATVAESGMAPHYTRPRLDGSRPGTYWFNTRRPTAGTGWDLEPVAFHETVPGHHSQLARLQHLPDLPLLQQISQTVHSEGWGLYAERLAGEAGLYSDTQAQIGAVYAELMRAVRLVVDTGLHAQRWSRSRAVAYFVEHVAMPEPFLANEIDRYIAWPGQALAYLVGQREILRLREETRVRLGAQYDMRTFHAAVLDSGSVPMPALAAIVGRLGA
jgi:uncharacterized protein (DUF885 family)